MARPVQEITFTGWLEDVFNTVPGFPKKTIATYWNSKLKKYYIVKVVSSSATSDPKGFEAYYFSESAETLRDIKGINTVVSLENFAKQPFGTLRTLGKQTVDDIRNIDEAGSDRLANTVEELVAGNTSRKDKSDLRTPDNMILWTAQKLGMGMTDTNGVIDSSGGTPKSKIQMIGSSIVGFGPSTEDRKVLEEGEDTNRAYKSYKALGASLAGVAGYVESTGTRSFYYNSALTEYNRSIANELGVNLTNTLPTQRYLITGSAAKVESALFDELKAGRPGFLGPGGSVQNLEDLVSDPARMQRALGIDITVLDLKTQEFLRGFVRSEVYQSIGIAPSYLRKPNKSSFTGKYVDAAGPPGSALANTPVFDPNDIITLKGKIIQKGFVDKEDFVAEVISNEALKQSILTQMQLQNAMAEVNADLTRIIIERGIAEFNAYNGTNHVNLAQLPTQAARDHITGAATRARDRVDSATRAMDLASKLQYYGSTKDLLNAIEEGNFLNLAFVSSRFFGLLPLVDSEFGFLKHLTAPVDKFADIYETKLITPTKNLLVGKLGLTYDPNAKTFFDKKVGKGILTTEGIVNVEWDVVHPVLGGKDIVHSHQVIVKASEGKGMFGAFSSTDISKKILGNGSQSAIYSDVLALGMPGLPARFADFNRLFSPSGGPGSALNIEDLMDHLSNAANRIINGQATGAQGLYYSLAEALGLTQFVTENGIRKYANFEKLNEQIAAMRTNGRQFMQKMDSLGLPASSRWEFLSGIIKQNKNGQFTNEFMGILERYNRYANALNSFLYKQVLWGQYGGTNALIKAGIKATTPARLLLRGIGFSDGWSLSQWVENQKMIQFSTNLGKLFTQYSTGQGAVANNFLAGILNGLSKSKFTASVMKSLGLLLTNSSAIATAGLSYLLMAFSDVGWAIFKNVFQLRFDRIGGEVKQIMLKKVNTVKKIVWGIFGCLIGCAILPILMVVIVVATIMAPIEGMGGGSFEDIIASKKVKIEKTEKLEGDTIKYTLKFTNIAVDENGNQNVDINITAIRDRLTHTASCSDGGATVDFGPTSTEYGSVFVNNVNQVPVPADLPGGGAIPAGQSVTLEYEVRGIKTTDGTYTNSVEATVEGEDAIRSAVTTVSTTIGDGGCVTCPSGWPLPSGNKISQGRFGSYSHGGTEAIDIVDTSSGDDTVDDVTSTHKGTVVQRGVESSDCQSLKTEWLANCLGANTSNCNVTDAEMFSVCGYGNFLRIEGQNGYESIYAHFDSISVNVGDSVTKGSPLGIKGSTGFSTAEHLHYEFPRLGIMCSDKEILMQNYPDLGESMIPETEDNCGGYGQSSCTVSW